MSQHDIEVSKLERELRYFPINSSSPKKLTKEQIDFFNANGYLSGFRIFNKDGVLNNRSNFNHILQKFMQQGKDGYAIDRYHDRFSSIYELATIPTILDYVEDLIGPNIICWATHYFCKMPGDDKEVAWHQDCSYWALTPSKTVTVWLAIDDADEENGCMQVIPGSHLHGLIAWRESDSSEKNVLTQTIDDAERFGKPVSVELKAGEISIHSDLLIHSSLPNSSHRRRCGLTLRYCSPDVRTYWGWNERSIICRGEDQSGHWASIPRPMSDEAP